jgi:hypothetical protein
MSETVTAKSTCIDKSASTDRPIARQRAAIRNDQLDIFLPSGQVQPVDAIAEEEIDERQKML